MMTGSYSFSLVAASYLVAVIASFVALDMAARVSASQGRGARIWVFGGGVAMGFGIWSMHFIGMLAFRLPIPQGFELAETLLSMLVAIVSSSYALWVVSAETMPRQQLLVGSLIMGGGIALMHYIGMAAMHMEPGIDYDPLWFAASIFIAVAAAGAALWIAFRLRSESRSNLRLRLLAALVMALAIVGMHYTGMAAAQFSAGSICGAATEGGISQQWLAALVGMTTFAILGMAMITAIFDRRLQEQTSLLSHSLQLANQELTYLALHDNLTKLPNRLLLEDRLGRASSKAAREQTRFAVMFVDLDGFKAVNDVYGHPIGDQLLLRIAENLASSITPDDTLARLGGDEFIIITERTEPAEVASYAEILLQCLALPIQLADVELQITASIGIALYGADGETAQELMTNADAAMYRAKVNGRNNYCFFEPSMNVGAHEQLALAQDLRRALALDQFTLNYQPKLRAPDGPLQGFEALLRWQHPRLGTVMPDTFIPIAERTGLIIEIGYWVINEACRQLMQWRAEGRQVPVIAVNLSPTQFRAPRLAERIEQTLLTHGMPPASLILEITESTAMREPEESLAILERLCALGVRISIDDFGTGYSSLLYLKRLPATELKIDRAFIKDLVAGGEDAAIVSAIIALGKTLHLSVIAEGVETATQQHLLTELGCDSLQGYHLGHPMDPRDIQFSDGPTPSASAPNRAS